jgi:pre-mRNA-splicing factor ATP-dependent RNA helicase DHX15/PRP43
MYIELASQQLVVCTHPRKVAAREMASRVATEMDVSLGEEVGVRYRNYNKTDKPKTRLKFVTEGILLREVVSDPSFSNYVSQAFFIPFCNFHYAHTVTGMCHH